MTQLNISEAQIRETAYLFWLDEGKPHGKDQEHWSKAVQVLTPARAKAKKNTESAAKPTKTKAASAKSSSKPARAKKASAKTSTRAKAAN